MNKNIKIIVSLVLVVIIAAFAFAGCSDKESGETEISTKTITTESAVIKESDAINLIKTYTAEELRLEGSLDDYSIMVNNSGHKIDGKYYVKVAASKVSEPGADGTVTIDTYGEYYINYDGSEILIYNKDDDTYTPIAEMHEVPETTVGEHSHSHDE